MLYELYQTGKQYFKRNHVGSTESRLNSPSLEAPTCENFLTNFKAAELNKPRSTSWFNSFNENNKEPVVIGNRPSVGLGLKLDLSKNKVNNYNAPLSPPIESTSECNLKKKIRR